MKPSKLVKQNGKFYLVQSNPSFRPRPRFTLFQSGRSGPRDYSWVLPAAAGIGIVAGIGLVGYGVYQFISGAAPNSGTKAAITQCGQQWQQAFVAYQKQYSYYLSQNGGQPLTQQQQQSLDPYVTIMNDAEQCSVNAANASTADWTAAITYMALGAIVAASTVLIVRAYLQGRGGVLRNGSEARATVRNAEVQSRVDSGEMDVDTAKANISATQDAVSTEGSSEVDALTGEADSISAEASATGDTSLVDSVSEFISEVIDTIQTTIIDVEIYFEALLA